MKKLLLIFLSIVITFSLCSCSATSRCNYDTLLNEIENLEEITVIVYKDTLVYKVNEFDDISNYMPTSLIKYDGIVKCNKLLSITLSTQYEITFFEDNFVMIYDGYCSVFEKDRQYYKYEKDFDVNLLINYLNSNAMLEKSED